MQLAQRPGLPQHVGHVQAAGFPDPQPGLAPQPRGGIAAGGGQVLAGHSEVVTPAVEELLQLGVGGRDADVQAPVVAGPVQLIDRGLDHLAGQCVDLHLVPQFEVLEEHRDPERLARDRGPGLATAALREKPVGVVRAGGPQVPAHRLTQLAHGLELRLHRLVRHPGRRAGEHEAGDQVLLERVQIPVTGVLSC
jgi:hypothetical protein